METGKAVSVELSSGSPFAGQVTARSLARGVDFCQLIMGDSLSSAILDARLRTLTPHGVEKCEKICSHR